MKESVRDVIIEALYENKSTVLVKNDIYDQDWHKHIGLPFIIKDKFYVISNDNRTQTSIRINGLGNICEYFFRVRITLMDEGFNNDDE